MDSRAFEFTSIAGETLEDKALRACEVIVSGMSICGGKIILDGLMVENAVKAFKFDTKHRGDAVKLRRGMDDKRARIFFTAQDAIFLMQHAVMNDSERDREASVMHLTNMKKCGWQTGAKPNNRDVNTAGARLHGYKEPEGVALDLAQAFGVLPKSSPNYGLKPKAP